MNPDYNTTWGNKMEILSGIRGQYKVHLDIFQAFSSNFSESLVGETFLYSRDNLIKLQGPIL